MYILAIFRFVILSLVNLPNSTTSLTGQFWLDPTDVEQEEFYCNILFSGFIKCFQKYN